MIQILEQAFRDAGFDVTGVRLMGIVRENGTQIDWPEGHIQKPNGEDE